MGLTLLAAMAFLPPRLRVWIRPACLSFVAGGGIGFFLVVVPLRDYFGVRENAAVIAWLVFVLTFMAVLTSRLKLELEKSGK